MTVNKLLCLHDDDNVLVLIGNVDIGEELSIEDTRFIMDRHLTLGHKLARQNIALGDVILKYGAPIGRAISHIPKGAHVHTHNIASNYTKTHTLYDAQAEYGDKT